MQGLFRYLDLRRTGAAFAACLGIAAALVPTSSATAATVTLSGGTTSCTYSNVSGTASGDFTFTCTGGSSPGNLSLNLSGIAASIPVTTGSTIFAVQRTGGTTGAVTGNLGVTGGCTLTSSSVSFQDASTTASPPTVTLNAGSALAGANCLVTLTAGTGSPAIVAPSSVSVGVVDPNASVSFAFSTATSTANFGATTPLQITVTRTGGTAGTYEVPFYVAGSLVDATGLLVAGGGTLAPPVAVVPPVAYAYAKLTFPAGSGASQTISYTPPAALPAGVTPPATIGFQLTNPNPVGTPPPGQVASLGATAAHVTTVQTLTGCATSATYVVPWTGGQTLVTQVKQNETAAVTYTPTGAVAAGTQRASVVIAETSTTGDQADVQYSISTCPGDFSSTSVACARHTQYTGGSLTFSIGPKSGTLPPPQPWTLVCELPVGTATVYFNLRQIKRPTPVPPNAPGTPSCQFTTCPVYVQFN